MKRILCWMLGLVSVSVLALSAGALYTNNSLVQRGGVNPLQDNVKLLLKADVAAPIVDYLPPGAFARYRLSGKSGKWHYVHYQGQSLVVYHKKFQLGYYQLAGIAVSERQLQVALLSSGVMFVLCLLLMVSWGRKPKKIAQEVAGEAARKVPVPRPNTYSKQQIENAYLQGKQHGESEGERRAAEKLSRRLAEKEKAIEKAAADKAKQLQSELVASIKAEFDVERESTIKDMKASYSALNQRYNDAIEKAKVFDVDIHSADFDRLLKGRLFEICIAELLTKKHDFTLLEWTPDKGFGKKIFVAANLHPDLVLANRAGEQFAIECKYRGGFGPLTADRFYDAVSWCKAKSLSNYQTFARKRDINVWVALGVGGNPGGPDMLGIVPLHILANASKLVFSTVKKVEEQYACQQDFLSGWRVEGDFQFDQDCFLRMSPLRAIKNASHLVES